MKKKIGQCLGIVIVLLAFITSSSLRYTHDVMHQQQDHAGGHQQEHSADHQHQPDTDACALCWYVFHQISATFEFTPLLPQADAMEFQTPQRGYVYLSHSDTIVGLKGNKDPPDYL